MKTIIEQPTFITAALPKPNIDTTITYRPLKFLVFAETKDGNLVYNTLTKQLLLLNDFEYEILQKKQIEYSKSLDYLIETYFFVPYDFNEIKCFTQLKNLFKLLDNDKSITNYVILPTTDCNARCFYCCEHGQKRVNMSEQTAIDTAKYIVENCYGKKVSIMWFGGEPLFNIAPINIISKYLRESNIEFSSNIISNAYLFDDTIIGISKNIWNVKSIQITLDGTEEIYNRTKNYIYSNCISPFKKVINNIQSLVDNEIKVIIRLNMDLFNKDNLYSLVDFLYNKFQNNHFVDIYIRLLFDNTSKLQSERSNIERKELYEEFIKFEDYIDSKGMYHAQKLNPVFIVNSCIGTNKHGTVIMPGGELGMCDLHTDSDLYGNIYDGITNHQIIKEFEVYKEPVDICTDCPIYPNCSRLKKCLYYTRDCEEYEQNRLIHQLKKYILHTYKHWKEHKC